MTLPDTVEAKAVRKYYEAQVNKDYSKSEDFFTEDVVFNGVAYKESGRDALSKGFQQWTSTGVTSFRLEAVNECGAPDRYLGLYWIVMAPLTTEQVMCDYITLRDGKVCRVDNCLDKSKVPMSDCSGQEKSA